MSKETSLSKKLMVIAEWLDAENNELLMEAQEKENSEYLEKVVEAFVLAAGVIKSGSEEIQALENTEVSVEQASVPALSEDKLEELASVASLLDATGDEDLIKKASVLDEILLTMCAPKNYAFNFKKAQEDKVNELRKNYQMPKEMLDVVADDRKLIEKSPYYKEKRPMEAALSTRYCPDHPGEMLSRVDDSMRQCPLDGKEYSYEAGFERADGAKVPGGTVMDQSQTNQAPGGIDFDTRESRVGINNL